MQRKTAVAIVVGCTVVLAAMFLLLTRAALEPSQKAAVEPAAPCDVQKEATEPFRQSFEDIQAFAQYFADELGRFKEQNQTILPAKLFEQANAENTCPVSTLADPGKKLDAETVYSRTKPGVVVVGGIFKCGKCNRWHVQCGSGFVVRRDRLILTAFHAVEAYKKLEGTTSYGSYLG